MQNCQDNYSTTFSSFPEIHSYHQDLTKQSVWTRCQVNGLRVEPLVSSSPSFPPLTDFAPGISKEAVDDTVDHLGLALKVNSKLYPIRDTAYKSLLDRAKVSGNGLTKLTKSELSQVLNLFLGHFKSEALVLVRDEKVSAVHSGDAADYSILPIDDLLNALQEKLDARFPGNLFEKGYSDHAITSASWSLPGQKEDLLGTYTRLLKAQGKSAMAARMTPGVRFITSDTGIASAKVSALLMGGQHPIHIGSCISVDHRHQANLRQFKADTENAALNSAREKVFAQFEDLVGVEAFEELREKQESFSDMEALEEKCFAIRGRVGTVAKFSMENSTPKLKVVRENDMTKEPYGGIFAHFGIEAE